MDFFPPQITDQKWNTNKHNLLFPQKIRSSNVDLIYIINIFTVCFHSLESIQADTLCSCVYYIDGTGAISQAGELEGSHRPDIFNWGLTWSLNNIKNFFFLQIKLSLSIQRKSQTTRKTWYLNIVKCFKKDVLLFLLYQPRYGLQIPEKWFIGRLLIIHRTNQKTKKLLEPIQSIVTLQ